MAKVPKYKVGDIVQLKSGGPKMTITTLDFNYSNVFEGYGCSWFAGANEKRAFFPEGTLEPSENNEKTQK